VAAWLALLATASALPAAAQPYDSIESFLRSDLRSEPEAEASADPVSELLRQPEGEPSLEPVAVLSRRPEAGPPAEAELPPEPEAEPEIRPQSEIAALMARWVMTTDDARGLPFMIIDKVTAEVLVFNADGQLEGIAPALMGLALGDESAPGIGDREMVTIKPEERTTPAGRFVAGFGPAVGRKDVFWVDFADAIALHPVVTSNPGERRTLRLNTLSPEDNRITYGCINVAYPFYENVVRRVFSGTSGVVYVLPDTRAVGEVFPAFDPQMQLRYASIGGREDASDRFADDDARVLGDPTRERMEASNAPYDEAPADRRADVSDFAAEDDPRSFAAAIGDHADASDIPGFDDDRAFGAPLDPEDDEAMATAPSI
jgi:hypothetical protein